MTFILDPQLQKDTHLMGHLPLCTLLLNRDKTFPWFILVPQIANIRELYQLSIGQQNQFMKESSLVSEILDDTFTPDKLNIAALGNVVTQLHIHHVVRYKTDQAWPAPIWGQQKEFYYSRQEAHEIADRINHLLRKRAPEYLPV